MGLSNSDAENMEQVNYDLPEDKKVLVEYISQLKSEIEGALLNRPVPSGKPYPDLAEASLEHLKEIETAIPKIEIALNELLYLFELKPESMADEISTRSIKAENNIRKWIEIYYSLWERPFPKGEEMAQTLISAFPEKVLRDVLGGFQQIIKIADAPDQAVKNYGSESMSLRINVNLDREAEQFEQYQKTHFSDTQSSLPPLEIQSPDTKQPKFRFLGFTVLIISLLIIFGLLASGKIMISAIGFLGLLFIINIMLNDE